MTTTSRIKDNILIVLFVYPYLTRLIDFGSVSDSLFTVLNTIQHRLFNCSDSTALL